MVFLVLDNNFDKEYSHTEVNADKGYLNFENTKISKPLIRDYFNIKSKDEAIAIFVVSDKFCTSCINEVVEYTDIVTNYINSDLNETETVTFGIVLGQDSNNFKKIKSLLNFPFESKYVETKSLFAEDLELLAENNRFNQIVLINLVESKIVARINIFTTLTSIEYKEKLVREAFFELN